MAITHCIAHAIRREGPDSAVSLQQAPAVLTLNGPLEELVRELKHAYLGKAGKQYGRFSSDYSVAVVGQWLRECCEEKMAFETFSGKAAEHLRSLLGETEVVIDGYLLIALEKLADSDAAYLFFIQPNEGVWLDGDLQLQKTFYLDVRGVTAAAKVELSDWLSGDDNSYLSVLRARGDKAFTDCFWQWVGFSDARDVAAETKVFLDVVTDYSEQLEAEEAHVYRNRVIDYCLEQDKKGEPVVIRDLSGHLNQEEPERFSRYVAERAERAERFAGSDADDGQKVKVPAEALHPDRKQLRHFVRISGRNDQLSMSFAAECLGETIVYNRESDSLTIQNLPAPLKLRLVQYLQKQKGGAGADE